MTEQGGGAAGRGSEAGLADMGFPAVALPVTCLEEQGVADNSLPPEPGGAMNEGGTDDAAVRLGWFSGVFAPVALSMFSSLLFLRVGYIVGNAGILYACLMLVLAYLILTATILSICAIATNGAVKGGGVYFMLSRTLGPELGGAIGLLFWAANTVGSALYVTACSESLFNSFGPNGIVHRILLEDDYWTRFAINLAVLIFILAVALVGAGAFGKLTAIFLGGVTVCAISVVFGFFAFQTKRLYVSVYNETTVPGCLGANCTFNASTGIFVGLGTRENDVPKEFVALAFDGFPGLAGGEARDCQDRTKPVSLFGVFGVLFSGVTGILAGVNLSGELREPSKAIPRGTGGATLFTFTVYLTMFLLTAFTCNRTLLLHECFYMYNLDYWGPMVSIGTILATFCASLSGLVGASRVLTYAAKDNIFGGTARKLLLGGGGGGGGWCCGRSLLPGRTGPGQTASGSENRDNLRRSVFLTSTAIFLLLFYNSLNSIAQICSVLFLLSYAAVNAACFFLDAFSAPNFRPTFRYFHALLSFVGFVSCLGVMVAISPAYAALALGLCVAMTTGVAYFSPAVHDSNWGSILQNLYLHQVRKYILKLDPRKEHVKYWRPHIILLVNNPRYNFNLIRFVNSMKKGGLYVLGHVRTPVPVQEDQGFLLHPEEPEVWPWLEVIDRLKVKAFAEQTVADSVRSGVSHLVRIVGLGALKPNTAVLGFYDGDEADPVCDYFEGRRDLGDLDHHFRPDRRRRIRSISESGEEESVVNAEQVVEYVLTLADIIRIRKNVCVCRNFRKIRHSEPLANEGIFRQMWDAITFNKPSDGVHGRMFIDVWLFDFTRDSEDNAAEDVRDRKYLFMLQMAHVVSISAEWKGKLEMRVFVRASPHNPKLALANLQAVLNEERVKATPHTVQFDNSSDYPSTEAYLHSINRDILNRSLGTAVTLLYMPPPPRARTVGMDGGEADPAFKEFVFKYWTRLKLLSEDLPPTVMIHGIHTVTCTAL